MHRRRQPRHHIEVQPGAAGPLASEEVRRATQSRCVTVLELENGCLNEALLNEANEARLAPCRSRATA